ncbi:uncharacterized protein TRIREDRAFT_77288 [Trichoderma reesei QM6a]|uniref:Predicted protein n=1 Tax=Hypocrea jecorina (strain QM6a) TaxID=431241 RepID=G0RH00_HYPJQ|nr:uncharacterized protein TRIREDRAFT_77288 [Trichoderma reesei QM6a]EGR49449.1 predicted protein [Trichoderma reesei QM6a]
MRLFTVLAVLPALGGLCQAAYRGNTLRPAVEADYDVIIVGGGPAGLSAASGLARVRRNVLLIDSGEYRNAPTRHLHDVIGFDGVTPAYFRWKARNQIREYGTVSLVNGTVTKIQPQADHSFFTVSADYPDEHNLTFTARKIILATGLRDLIPSTPGLRENWGKGIYWCPWCDGHEHADQQLGILGPLEKGPNTPDQRTATEEDFPQWEEYLKLHSINIDNRIITSIERLSNGTTGDEDPSLPSVPEHDLFQLNFETGDPVLRAAILTNFETAQKSTLGEEIGVALYGGKLAVDASRGLVTNIPGVFAIGDANSDNTTNIPHAMYSGKKTAVYIQVELETENADAELSVQATKTKRGLENYMRALWARMNVPGEVLYAGDFDQ